MKKIKNTASNSNNSPDKKAFFTKSVKAGSYSFAVSAILLAVLIVFNLIINALPKKYTVLDTSVSDMFTLSETSEKFVSHIEKDVKIYFICEDGNTDQELLTFIERYADLSKKVKLEIIDPVKSPEFISKYTDEKLSNYSVIVESDLRYRVINNPQLYYYYVEGYGKIDSSDTYTLQLLNYYGYSYSSYFNGEKAITNAIEYVVSSNVPSLYFLSGHGENMLPEILLGALEDYNFEYKTLNILDDSVKIPEDTSGIIIYDPTSDLTELETSCILEYLKNGGKLYLSTSSKAQGFKNLMSVTEYYGASAAEGIVYEGKSGNYPTNMPYCIYAQINSDFDAIKDTASGKYKILFPSAHPIVLNSVRDTVTQTVLFNTSDEAYTMIGEKKSESSAMNLGVAISEGDTKIVWLSSEKVLEQNYAEAVSYGNYYYFLDTLCWTAESFKSGLKEIDGTLMDAPRLTVSAKSAKIWGGIFIAVIPIVILACGILVWHKRRKR